MDLKSLELPRDQSAAIRQLAENHHKLIVVTLSAGALEMSDWIEGTSAVLSSWFAGQATGEAIADVLTGKVNPGGKLSFTVGKKLNDYACHRLGLWPQRAILDSLPKNAPADPKQRIAIHGYDLNYDEGIFMGYRWFDKQAIEPLFPFGFGLSYTTFEIENAGIKLNSAKTSDPQAEVKVKVTNTGKQAGSEVVQVYVGDVQCSVPRPARELKGFTKVYLNPGESKTVTIRLDKRSFAFWNTGTHRWDVEPGDFNLQVGNSSRNILFTQKVNLKP
jgi:beta-glucosidase